MELKTIKYLELQTSHFFYFPNKADNSLREELKSKLSNFFSHHPIFRTTNPQDFIDSLQFIQVSFPEKFEQLMLPYQYVQNNSVNTSFNNRKFIDFFAMAENKTNQRNEAKKTNKITLTPTLTKQIDISEINKNEEQKVVIKETNYD